MKKCCVCLAEFEPKKNAKKFELKHLCKRCREAGEASIKNENGVLTIKM